MNRHLVRLADAVRDLTIDAGAAILDIDRRAYESDVQTKRDGSPLTRADVASHDVLIEGLRALTPDVPAVSEEGCGVPNDARESCRHYWLVDPLDGTKEFLAGNGEFTVNVALIEDRGGSGSPVLGVVHAPVLATTYVGVRGHGATLHDHETSTPIAAAPPGVTVRVVASRSHGNMATDAFIEGLAEHVGSIERSSCGSALKLCRVAEGRCHYYPRVAPTMAWDTAAAQAVVEAANAVVWQYGTRQPLRYRLRSLRNPPFLVAYGAEAHLPRHYFTEDLP